MKLAILTCGMLPIPAIQGGAVENLIDFYLEYNNKHQLYDITVYSPWDSKIVHHPALSSNVNHYIFIDVSSLKARIARKLYGYLHHDEYYNHFIEYYFEKVYADLKKKDFDYIIIENGAGLAYKLSQRGYRNLILHMHNEVRPERSQYHEVVFGSFTKIITVSDYIKQKAAALSPVAVRASYLIRKKFLKHMISVQRRYRQKVKCQEHQRESICITESISKSTEYK